MEAEHAVVEFFVFWVDYEEDEVDVLFGTGFDDFSDEAHDGELSSDGGLGDESPDGSDFVIESSEWVDEVFEFGVDAESCGSIFGEGDGAEELVVF